MQVICTLPNASHEINGVKFSPHEDESVISEEISAEVAEQFLSIPGYAVRDAASSAAAAQAEADKAAAIALAAQEKANKAAAEASAAASKPVTPAKAKKAVEPVKVAATMAEDKPAAPAESVAAPVGDKGEDPDTTF